MVFYIYKTALKYNRALISCQRSRTDESFYRMTTMTTMITIARPIMLLLNDHPAM